MVTIQPGPNGGGLQGQMQLGPHQTGRVVCSVIPLSLAQSSQQQQGTILTEAKSLFIVPQQNIEYATTILKPDPELK